MKKILMVLSCASMLGMYPNTGEGAMKITSAAFSDNQMIPRKFTCQGDDVNPPLAINAVPAGTRSLALIVDDPDAPMGTWVHWVVFNIPPDTTSIGENSIPGEPAGNNFGRPNYGGPCPPSGTHRYFFKIYALDTLLQSADISSKADLEQSMAGHILGQAQLIGLYQKSR